MERIAQSVSGLVARQLVAEILELLELFPDVLDRIVGTVDIVVVVPLLDGARGPSREALPLVLEDIGIDGLAGGRRVVRFKFCRTPRRAVAGPDR